jgi:hypothetical protein
VTDDPRRRADDHHPTVGEIARRLDRHETRSERLHRDMIRMIERLDERADTLTVRVAIIIGVAGIVWSVLVVIAPVLRSAFGLDG